MKKICLYAVMAVITAGILIACSQPSGTTGSGIVTGTGTGTGSPNPADIPDGWASSGSSYLASPGGYGASAGNIYHVTTRAEFINALKCGGSSYSTTKKIIYVDGMIDLLGGHDGSYYVVNTSGLSQTYSSYADYKAKFAASCFNGAAATLAADQSKLYNAQKAEMSITVPSNTTILGIGNDSGFQYGALGVSDSLNVVIRNILIFDAYDWFPSWYQSSENNFNSEYDNLTVSNSTYVWIDHCTLSDGDRPDSGLTYVTTGSGTSLKWIAHDGLLDVVRGANYVTVSWNTIENHDKTSLFGNSDSSTTDTGKLKITVHHNFYNNAKQRLPRVRFGSVHVYNNYYLNSSSTCIGIGDYARIYSEANYFESCSTPFAKYDDSSNEGYFYDEGSNTTSGTEAMASAAQVGWDPETYYTYTLETAAAAKTSVLAGAGVGRF